MAWQGTRAGRQPAHNPLLPLSCLLPPSCLPIYPLTCDGEQVERFLEGAVAGGSDAIDGLHIRIPEHPVKHQDHL